MNKLTFDKRTQSDIDLESCQKHSDLCVLNLSGSMVLGYGFEYLLDNRNLKEVYLRSTPIKSQYMHILSGLPALEVVDISDTGIDDVGLNALAGIKALRVLIADRVKTIGDGGLQGFDSSACAGTLQKLSLAATAIGDDGAALIGRLSALKSLSLNSAHVTTSGVLALCNLAQLEHLDLAFTQVGDGAMAALSAMKALQALDLSGTPVSPAGVKALSRAVSLKELSLSLAFGDGMVEALSGCQKLETLRLFDGRLDKSLATLKSIDSLRALELVFVNLSSQALAGLKELKQLELLVMDDDHSPLAREMHKALPACMIRFED
jgi:Leucine-rich repeat (LRR) protein